MKRQPQPIHPLKQLLAALFGGIFLFGILLILSTVAWQLAFAGRIFPGVSVAGVDVSGLSPNAAALKLSQQLSFPITGKILFRHAGQVWLASPAELGMVFDPSASALSAYHLGRSGGLPAAFLGQVRALGTGVDVSPVLIFDQRVAYQYLQNIAGVIDQPVIEASLTLQGADVIATPGQVGYLLDLTGTLERLSLQLASFRDGEVGLIINEFKPALVDLSTQAAQAREILRQPLTLTLPNAAPGDPGPWLYDVPVLAKMLKFEPVLDNGVSTLKVGLDLAALQKSLQELQVFVDRQPVNARFIFNDETALLDPFTPSIVGRTMDLTASLAAINQALLRGEHTVPLVVAEQKPQVADGALGTDLGITQNIATHTTYFYGSSEERVQNIIAAAQQFHGLLVAPGETFSMGAALGDVSLENGFAEALIIYGGRTIKGVGGGVCQVSTTLFRTVFNAGFPVIERHSHAYRVSYYERVAGGAIDSNLAGLDATVYFPLVDFKFRNDTPYWILMETYVNTGERRITWKLYSTSDGRSVTWETTGPTNIQPALPPVFEENPELPAGEIRQVDYAAQGADVNVTRNVWRDGQILFTDNFQTHYQPWAAVCEYGPGTEDVEKNAHKNKICLTPNN